jgi:hypothetical protein
VALQQQQFRFQQATLDFQRQMAERQTLLLEEIRSSLQAQRQDYTAQSFRDS